MQTMRRRLWIDSFVIVSLALLAGCSGSNDGDAASANGGRTAAEWAAELGPPEIFTWDDQPISFAPPPASWERQREQSGGLLGARFVKYEQGGQAIHFAEVTKVGQRDRCSELEQLLKEVEEPSFLGDLQRARPYRNGFINGTEKMNSTAVQERLDRAAQAHRARDFSEARSAISKALYAMHFVKYSLDEVVGPALFTGKGYEKFGQIEVFDPYPGEAVAGQPSLVLEYLLAVRDKKQIFYGRKVYVEYNNRLFEASFQGVKEYMPLFEAMLASVSFPEGPCVH